MDWDKLRLFYHVASTESFTHAAVKLHTSQSAISRQIKALEYEVGCVLFKRHPRGLQLTPRGEVLYRTAREIFSKITMTKATLDEESRECDEGTLTIATTVAVASLILPQYIPDFLKEHPKVNFNIISGDQELDLAIKEADVLLRPRIPHQPDLIQRYLMTFHVKLYASPTYIKENGLPQTLEDLDNHRLLTFGNDSIHPYANINWILRAGARTHHAREPYLTVNTAIGLRRAAEAGMGIASLSQEYPGIEESNLIEILQDIKGPEADLYFIYPEQLKHSKKVLVFADYLEMRLKKA